MLPSGLSVLVKQVAARRCPRDGVICQWLQSCPQKQDPPDDKVMLADSDVINTSYWISYEALTNLINWLSSFYFRKI